MFHFFRRGSAIYWAESLDLVAAAHSAALRAIVRGFPAPSTIESTNLHPTRLGYAWHLNGPNDVG